MDISKEIMRAQEQLHIEKLSKHQVEAINSILEHRDTMVIAPTSPENVPIYSIPALLLQGTTLVIIPSVSPIYDQSDKLRCVMTDRYNVAIEGVNSDYKRIVGQLYNINDKTQILFIESTCLRDPKFVESITDTEINMVVVYEAHCVTSQGYGFRPDYLRISKFINTRRHKPVVVALTATATPDMRTEICDLLSMQQPEVFANDSLRRPNLHFITRVFESDTAKLKELKRLLKEHRDGTCIVYCNTNEMTDAVYDRVQEWYPGEAVKCHSDLYRPVRKVNEQLLLEGEQHIMIVTAACGFGVDQSDVDLVIHFSLPLSLIDYYQQTGRAGYAGQKVKCILLYCENDYHVNRMLLAKAAPKDAFGALDAMKEYAESSECLTSQILSALGEKLDKSCGTCSNCQRRK